MKLILYHLNLLEYYTKKWKPKTEEEKQIQTEILDFCGKINKYK